MSDQKVIKQYYPATESSIAEMLADSCEKILEKDYFIDIISGPIKGFMVKGEQSIAIVTYIIIAHKIME